MLNNSRSITRLVSLSAIALMFASCLIAPRSDAQTLKSEQRPEKEVEVEIRGEKIKIPDLNLRDQDGRRVRFYSDLIKDKVVVLSFFFTSCTYLCTRQGKVFSELQSLLGERLGKSVFLIFVTTNPAKDNPQQLKAWGERYKLKPGWTLVTGEEAEMNELLVRFTGSKAGGGMHLATTFIGNDRTGSWNSAVGIFAPEDLLKAVNQIDTTTLPKVSLDSRRR